MRRRKKPRDFDFDKWLTSIEKIWSYLRRKRRTRGTRKILKVESLSLPDTMTIVEVSSLPKLVDSADKGDLILETEDGYYLVKDRVTFRVAKPEAQPRII